MAIIQKSQVIKYNKLFTVSRMMTDIVWCIGIFEVVGYYGHRILHTKSLYKYHKVGHS